MSTPKDTLYKQRQAEFRGLNKQKYWVPKGFSPAQYQPTLAMIFHKDIYHSTKTKR